MDTEANRRAMPAADRRLGGTRVGGRAILFLTSHAAANVTGTLLAV